jgi:hypothetical protein
MGFGMVRRGAPRIDLGRVRQEAQTEPSLGGAGERAEADRRCKAPRYERSEEPRDTRAGHYEPKLWTKG